MAASLSTVTDLIRAAWPTGTITTDADGVKRYTLSPEDVRKLRGLLAGALRDSGGKPVFRVSGIDTVVAPVALDKWGGPLLLGLAGVFLLGRMSAVRR